MRTVILVSVLVVTAPVHAGPFDGHWKYQSATADPLYGEAEALHMVVSVSGTRVCGSYLSTYRGGMRVMEGNFAGTVNGPTAHLTYEAGWADVHGEGAAQLTVKGDSLQWRVVKSGPEPDYMIHQAVLRRSESLLQLPSNCSQTTAPGPSLEQTPGGAVRVQR